MSHDFPYGPTEIAHLCRIPEMRRVVEYYERAGIRPSRPVEEDPYAALMRSINDQLISLQAAASIWSRICARYGATDVAPVAGADALHDTTGCPAPAVLAQADIEELHACGTTRKKAEYMRDISAKVVSGELDLAAMRAWSDEDIVARLVSLRGIGQWSAEMLLIHAYERPNVISYGDAAIRRGVCMAFSLDAKQLDRAMFDELTAPFSPFATTASIYLWRLSKENGWDTAHAQYVDSAESSCV